MLRFLRKFPQIVKDLFRLVQDTVSAAFLVENRHEVSLIGAAAFISVSKGTDVLLFHAREVLVQLGVKIFSVTLPERYAHSKAQNAFDASIKAIFQNATQTLFRIIAKGENRREPDNRGNMPALHDFQRMIPLSGGADVRL